MRTSELSCLLAHYPALRLLGARDLARLESAAAPLDRAAGRPLFAIGARAEAFPFVLEGAVRVWLRTDDGREVQVYHVGPGESCLVSALALLGDAPLAASATVEEAVWGLALPGATFAALIREAPPFLRLVFQGLTARLASLLALVDALAFRRIDERLASHLLHHQQTVSATHQQLADDLGTSREVVSRILGTFQDEGLIRLGRRRIELLDRGALRQRRCGRERQG